MVRVPNGSVSNPDAIQLRGDARVFELLPGGEFDQNGHEQLLRFHAAAGLLAKHLLKEDALVGHVLVDDPQAIASGGHDEAVMNLAERAQFGQRGQALRDLGVFGGKARVRFGHGQGADGLSS